MAKTKAEKKEIVAEYGQKLADSKALIVLKPNKITPNEATDIKKQLFESDAEYHVVKNTLFKIAMEKADLEKIDSLESGSHGVVYMKDDIVTPSKVVNKFIEETFNKETKEAKFEIVGGFLDGEMLSKEQVTELAEMPDFEGSISLILGVLDQAMAGTVNVLEDTARSLATILDLAFTEEEK